MTESTIIVGYIIAICAVFGFSAVSAFDRRQKTFSGKIFLLSVTICIPIMIWVGLFPIYSVIVSALTIAGILVMGGENE